MQKLIKDAVQEIKNISRQEIGIHILSPGKTIVAVDIKMLSQVIKNLVSNAIKFSHRGSAINIYVESLTQKVKISVSDSGLGFNPEDSDKLFQRFSKLSKAGTENEASTGMGLYLSKKIVEAHNGKLIANSQGVNRGSVFAIEI